MNSVNYMFSTLTDINECDMGVCDDNSDCFNTNGSFECICRKGFTGDGLKCNGNKPQ